ncbi:MAG TPA: lipopolysaccharide heptosyltransferase I [Sulfurospirillum sp. UBA11407]|nr:MAG TPA: lipopolysaccharide heptosyltransferase I [Sulfurospirillum sp. UBA11407]
MKIAIVKLSALGDIVHAMIVLQYIKKSFPKSSIDWFVEKEFCQILQNNPDIDNIYTLSLKRKKSNFYNEFIRLNSIGKKNKYDFIIDLQGLIKSALVSRLLGKNVIGFDRKSIREQLACLFYAKTFKIGYEQNVIARNTMLVCKALNLPIPKLEEKKPFLFSTSKSQINPTLLIVIGSSWKSKIYPKESFLKIVQTLNVETFISWGNLQEKQDAQFICDASHAKLLPKLNLDELKSVISNSSLIIGADSGPTHMAWALNRPSITIFGPTPSYRNTMLTSINLVIDCNKVINAKKLDKKDFCIQAIDPNEIIQKAKVLLAC